MLILNCISHLLANMSIVVSSSCNTSALVSDMVSHCIFVISKLADVTGYAAVKILHVYEKW